MIGTFRLEVDPARRQVIVAEVATRSSGLHVPAVVVQDGNPASNPPETFQIVTLGVRLPGEGTCPATDNCFDLRVDSFLSRNARQVSLVVDGVVPLRVMSNADTPPVDWGIGSPFGVLVFGDVPAGGSSSVEEMRFAIPNLGPYVVYMSLFEADPVTLAPGVVGNAWEADAPLQAGACGSQSHPALAVSGAQALLAWRGSCGEQSPIDLQLVDATGAPVPGTRAIIDGARPAGTVSVAAGGGGYLVTWADGRTGTMRVYASRVSSAGVVLDPGGFLVAPGGTGTQDLPSVAYTGQRFVVSWTDYRNGTANPDIYTATVDGSGLLSPAGGIAFAATAAAETGSWADGHATGAAIAWSDGTDGRISRVALDGTRIDATAVRLPGVDAAPLLGVRCSAATCIASWFENNAYWTRAFSVTTGLTGIDAAVVATQAAAGLGRSPLAIDYDAASDRFMLFWQHERVGTGPATMRAYRIRASGPNAGQGADPAGVTLFPLARQILSGAVAAVVVGNNHVLVWSDLSRGTGGKLYVRTVTPALLASPEAVAAFGENEQAAPAVAFDGASYYVVWTDHRGPIPDLYGRRFDALGTPLGPSTLIGSDVQDGAAIAAGADGWLVAWLPRSPTSFPGPRLQTRRITANGALLPVVELGLASRFERIDIAYSGSTYVVMSGTRAQIMAPDGSAIGFAFSVPVDAFAGVTFDGNDFMVAGTSGGSFDAVGSITRVSPLGGVGATVDVAGPLAYPPIAVAVASNASMTVVLYIDSGPPDGNPNPELWARAMPAGGVFGTPFRVSATTRRAFALSGFLSIQLASDGQRFFAAWMGDDGPYGTWLDGSGNVTHPDGFLVASEPGARLSLATGEPGYVVMASTTFVRSTPEAAPRVLVRRIGGP